MRDSPLGAMFYIGANAAIFIVLVKFIGGMLVKAHILPVGAANVIGML